MIYIHRFLFVILFVFISVIGVFITLAMYVLVTPFYTLAYYIKYGCVASSIQVDKLCLIPINLLFKLLTYLKPKKDEYGLQ